MGQLHNCGMADLPNIPINEAAEFFYRAEQNGCLKILIG